MKKNGIPWRDDFPMREEVEDFAGKTRHFVIVCNEGPMGFTLRAREEVATGEGYEFGAYSETSPYSALGRLRGKIRLALATRHISKSNDGYRLLHDRLRGRIAWSEKEGLSFVVDGQEVAPRDLQKILETYEGWEFDLRIRDSLE